MDDIEMGDSKMASLRQRKIRDNVVGEKKVTSASPSYEPKTTNHSKLVRQINNLTDDDDEEERQFKQFMVQKQMHSSQEMAKSMMRTLMMMAGIIIILFTFLSMTENSNNQNASSLTKALRILMGMNNNRRVGLPSSAKLVSSTSILKSDMEDFVYPSWFRRRTSGKKVQYLVPNVAEDEPIRQILHRKLSIKAKVDVDVELFDRYDMHLFLSGDNGQYCQEAMDDSENVLSTILEQFQHFGDIGYGDGQKALWVWCMMYSKQAYAFLDLERYEVKLSRNLFHDLSAGKVRNLFIGAHGESIEGDDARINHSSILFMPEQGKSDVAKGMLQYLTRKIGPSKEAALQLLHESEGRMLSLIESESDLWTPLEYVSRQNKKAKRPFLEICMEKNICYSAMPNLSKKWNSRAQFS